MACYSVRKVNGCTKIENKELGVHWCKEFSLCGHKKIIHHVCVRKYPMRMLKNNVSVGNQPYVDVKKYLYVSVRN